MMPCSDPMVTEAWGVEVSMPSTSMLEGLGGGVRGQDRRRGGRRGPVETVVPPGRKEVLDQDADGLHAGLPSSALRMQRYVAPGLPLAVAHLDAQVVFRQEWLHHVAPLHDDDVRRIEELVVAEVDHLLHALQPVHVHVDERV